MISTSVFCPCLSWSKWTTFLVSTSKVTVLKNLYSLYIPIIRPAFFSTSVIELRSLVGSIKTWGEQKKFYFLRYLAVACHKLNHFTSQVVILDFFGNYRRLQEAKKFSRYPGQFECVLLRKLYITYQSRNS